MHSVTMCVHKVWKAFIHLVNVALLSGWFSRKSDSSLDMRRRIQLPLGW
uniref:Uncharacterized protein n=1 Tax=Peromyscus maniculatus bairdii TaxID=230844 RepID=A0A8C8UEC9_PERMB